MEWTITPYRHRHCHFHRHAHTHAHRYRHRYAHQHAYKHPQPYAHADKHPYPTRSIPVQSGPYPPLTMSLTLNWRLDPQSDTHAIADVVISAAGGNGFYTYYRDDILQAGPAFSYYWRRCALNPVSFRVDSGDGQTARLGRAEIAPCGP